MSKKHHRHEYIPPPAHGIYLISPSSAVQDPKALDRALARLQAAGFQVKADRAALAAHQRFAGTDKERLAGLNRAIRQKLPIVMATRGGYGLSRLLPHIDWKAMADSGKRFVGMSDFTAFNLALLARTGAVSYTGASAVADFGADELDDLTPALFGELMRGELEILSFETPDADPADCRGVLWGGTLSMVVSLLGTPYMPGTRGILFLEDVAEHPYRVERMLAQLWQAGVLQRQKAILLGRFTDYHLAPHDAGYDMPEVLKWLRRVAKKVPVITGLPYGHIRSKATLPIGQKVGLATEKGMAHLVLDEHRH
jgi:muramoyltetrapeptide carboxypeptidase